MIDRGPFDGGFSAKLVVHNHPIESKKIMDGLDSIICIAFVDSNGKLNFQLVSAEHPSRETLELQAVGRVFLPVYVLRTPRYSPFDAAPKPVG